MRPPRAIDDGIFQIQTSDYVEPRDPFDGQFEYDSQNKTLIISPVDGQDDFPIDGLYQLYKNEDYAKYRIKLSASGDLNNPDETITVMAGNLIAEVEAALTAGTWHMKVVPITSEVPDIPDEITGVSISIGADSVTEGSSITRVGSVQGTGDYNTSGTWTRQSGSATTFTVTGNSIIITGATSGTSDVFRFTADDGTFAEITIEVTEADANPTIQNDSIEGELIALNDIYDQTDGANWTNNTGWPIPDTASMGDAYGIEVWTQSDVDADPDADNTWFGRVREVRLKNNGLINVEWDEVNERPRVVNLAGDDIEIEPDGEGTVQGSGLTGMAINDDIEFRWQERYVPLEGKGLKSSIGNLQKVKVFDIIYNYLGGVLPNQVYNLPECERLAINFQSPNDRYRDSGSNPWDPREPYPNKWNVWGNKFLGRIHPSIGTMQKLKSIFLFRNFFDGTTYPMQELWSLPQLEHLVVSHNGVEVEFIDDVPAWTDTLKALIFYPGTSQFNRNIGNKEPVSPPRSVGNLPAGVGFCQILRGLRIGYFDNEISIPPEWENFTSLSLLEIGNPLLVGDFPHFLDKRKTALHTLVLNNANFNQPIGYIDGNGDFQEGLEPDAETTMSGKYEIMNIPVGGVTPLGWRDAEDDNFPKNVQIWGIANCGIGGPFTNSLHTLTNAKILRLQGNNFTTPLPIDFPTNFRLGTFQMGNSFQSGEIKNTLRKIVASRLWIINFSNNGLTDYEIGTFSSVDFEFYEAEGYYTGGVSEYEDGIGNMVQGYSVGDPVYRIKRTWKPIEPDPNDSNLINGDPSTHPDAYRGYTNGLGGWDFSDKRFRIELNGNQFTQPVLDNIILDVYDNLLAREGTPLELDKAFKLDLSNQRTGEQPSMDDPAIQTAISYMEQYTEPNNNNIGVFI